MPAEKTHSFPSFYACYLLKSMMTKKSTLTYIGSTPDPPRRLRQHNGEIAQGAWKTSRNRPWVMQMIVHGFPSRLAALQFEWAWQHPNKSRHLRTPSLETVAQERVTLFNTARKNMKSSVTAVRTMLAIHPYNIWPLRVKLFTPEALKVWEKVNQERVSAFPLPAGFECSIELEGVNGKNAITSESGPVRCGPIEVTDETFTCQHLAKYSRILSSGKARRCSICEEALDVTAQNSLRIALCPTDDCVSFSHLHCLSQEFLKSESLTSSAMIPRGGTCKSCKEHHLWGDIVRASYRRYAGGATVLTEEPDEEEQDVSSDVLTPKKKAKKRSEKKKVRKMKKVIVERVATETEASEDEEVTVILRKSSKKAGLVPSRSRSRSNSSLSRSFSQLSVMDDDDVIIVSD